MDASATTPGTRIKARRNWWKVAFFALLFVFELTREIAVISAAGVAQPNSQATMFQWEGFVRAEGSWKRIDGGGKLVPGTVTIECRPERKECTEASVRVMDDYVFAPELDHFAATFTADAVTYVNDVPDCAKYSVRLDLALKKVFAVRERKEAPANPNCALLEKGRIEMQLGDGYDSDTDPLQGHFVPLLRLLGAIF